MATLKWAGATTVSQLLGLGADLQNNNMTALALSAVVNNQTDLNTYAWFELVGTFDTAGTWDAYPTIDVFMNQAMNGTTYEDPPVTGQPHGYLISIPVQKHGSPQRVLAGPVPLPPHKMRFAIDNQTGQTLLASGMTLNIGINNLASV